MPEPVMQERASNAGVSPRKDVQSSDPEHKAYADLQILDLK